MKEGIVLVASEILTIILVAVIMYVAAATGANYIDSIMCKPNPLNLRTADIDSLIEAMIIVESHGNNYAIGQHDEVGCLQIRPIAVKDVNRIITSTPALMHMDLYKLNDRYDRTKSIEMCRIYILHYGSKAMDSMPYQSLEVLARIWNGGPKGHLRTSTEKYWAKVQKEMR